MNLVCMLEQLVNNGAHKDQSLFYSLPKEDQEKVVAWYKKHSGCKDIAVTDLLNLMTTFFERENLYLYDNAEFSRVGKEISEKYGILSEEFLNMYISFCEMISQ